MNTKRMNIANNQNFAREITDLLESKFDVDSLDNTVQNGLELDQNYTNDSDFYSDPSIETNEEPFQEEENFKTLSNNYVNFRLICK